MRALPLLPLLALTACATTAPPPRAPLHEEDGEVAAGTIAGVLVRREDDGALEPVAGCPVQLRRVRPREALRLQLSFSPAMGPLSFEDPEPPLPTEEALRFSGESDEAGRFSFAGLTRGPWLLEAACGGRLTGKVVRVGEGPRERVELRLRERKYTVDGRVEAPDGRPVAGARVRVASGGTGVVEGTTDADGEFSLESASKLVVIAVAIAEGYAEGSGSRSFFEHGPVVVRLQPATRLSGLVMGAEGPRAGAVVLADGGRRRRVTGPDGGFSFDDLAPGPIRLVAFDGASTTGTVELLLSASTPAVRLVLVPPAMIEVTARDPKGAPVADAELSVSTEGPAPTRGATGEDGRAIFPAIPAGEVVLHVRKEGFAKRDVTLTLAGGTRSFLDVALEPAFDVVVRVRREGALPLPPDLDVDLERADGERRPGAKVRGGRALLKDLPPGAYRVRAEVCAFTKLEAAFEVPGPAPELVLPPCGLVQGRVLTDDGDPAPFAEVSAIRDVPGRTSSVRREVEKDGSFRLELPPGSWKLRAHRHATDVEGSPPLDVTTDAEGLELRLP